MHSTSAAPVYRIFDGTVCESSDNKSPIFPAQMSNASTCYLNGQESIIYTCQIGGDLVVENFNGTTCEGSPYKVTTTETGVCVPATLTNHSVSTACMLHDISIPRTVTPIQFVGPNITLPVATYCNLTDGDNCTGFITASYSDVLCSITLTDIAQSISFDNSICYYDPATANRVRMSCSGIACTRSMFSYDCIDSHYYGEQVAYLDRCVQIASGWYQQSFFIAERQTSGFTPHSAAASSASLSMWHLVMTIAFTILFISTSSPLST